ncbi:YcaO-like family protein [Advenella mimigardefordensis]|uniref:YcaO domain-containing protein n=1 Tax=Advenella mimigardefordensis (strain DSM 17166 / LMG 22922 / DPN7) TaxID=1247726 RepID=W0PKA3_ADVMD|nr:YcaO-like family protein [Advenella mimigardefordensis]AHG65423.1 hypothetical protein MIM_c33620 [Advenella mimigardefordensis DPN7]
MDIRPHIKTISRINICNENYWVAKAGIGTTDSNGKKHYIFGFGSHKERRIAETSAYYECIEHFFGSRCAYNNDQLMEPIQVLSHFRDIERGTAARVSFLIGTKSNNQALNATGLAVGETLDRAKRHGELEMYERHITHCWWHGKLKLGKPIFHSMDDAHYRIVWESPFYKYSIRYALAIHVDFKLGYIASGSACRSSGVDATAHALAECEMIRDSVVMARCRENGEKLSQRSVNRLLRKYTEKELHEFVFRMENDSKFITYAKKQPLSYFSILDDLHPYYAVLYSDKNMVCIRSQSNSANDISLGPPNESDEVWPFF